MLIIMYVYGDLPKKRSEKNLKRMWKLAFVAAAVALTFALPSVCAVEAVNVIPVETIGDTLSEWMPTIIEITVMTMVITLISGLAYRRRR